MTRFMWPQSWFALLTCHSFSVSREDVLDWLARKFILDARWHRRPLNLELGQLLSSLLYCTDILILYLFRLLSFCLSYTHAFVSVRISSLWAHRTGDSQYLGYDVTVCASSTLLVGEQIEGDRPSDRNTHGPSASNDHTVARNMTQTAETEMGWKAIESWCKVC